MDKQSKIKIAYDEIIVKGNLDKIDEYFSENYVAHTGDNIYKGHIFLKQYVNQLRASIPDIQIRKIHIITQSDDILIWQRTLYGTHKFNMLGIPPSGKIIEWTEMISTRFEDEKVVEEWVVSEVVGKLLLRL